MVPGLRLSLPNVAGNTLEFPGECWNTPGFLRKSLLHLLSKGYNVIDCFMIVFSIDLVSKLGEIQYGEK